MQLFNNSLSTFLIECRESALDELKQDERYGEWTRKRGEIVTQIEALLTPEGITLFEEYQEIMTAVMSLEYNRTLVCGLTTQNSILKRFDSSSPEFSSFLATFLNTTSNQPN